MILRQSGVAAKGYCSAVKLSTLIGFTGGILTTLSEAIWWRHLWSWGLINLLYATLTFMIAGLVLAKLLPKPETASE